MVPRVGFALHFSVHEDNILPFLEHRCNDHDIIFIHVFKIPFGLSLTGEHMPHEAIMLAINAQGSAPY